MRATRSSIPPCSRLSPRYITNGESPRNGSAVRTAWARPRGVVLHDVGDRDAETRTVPGRRADLLAGLGGDDDPDLVDAGLRHRLDAVEQHRLVGDRNQLLGARVGDRAQPRALAAREDQALQGLASPAERTGRTRYGAACRARPTSGARDDLARSRRDRQPWPAAIALAAATNRRAGVRGLEHDRVAGLLEHLADEPVDAGEAEARRPPNRPAARAITVRSSRAQRARSGEIQTRARREAGTSPVRGQPSTSAAGSMSGRGLERLVGDAGRLDPVQAEMAHARRGRGRSWPRTSPRDR